MKEGREKEGRCVALLCPLSQSSSSGERERKFLCERCQIRRNFLPFLSISDREEFLLALSVFSVHCSCDDDN